MSRFKTQVERDMKKTVKDLQDKRSTILEDFAKAYMVEKGVLPSQIRLVEKQGTNKVEWHFALKEELPTGLKKFWFTVKFHSRSIKFKIIKSISFLKK